MTKLSKHVVSSPAGGWAVINTGASRATRTFGTQAEAIKFGRTVAKKMHAELYVHSRDGTIKAKISYGSDPFMPKDSH